VDEGNAFPLGSDSRHLVDEPDSSRPAAFECGAQIGCRKGDMVDPRAAPRDELVDRTPWGRRLEEFDECITRAERGNPGAVGVIDGHDWHAENVAVERKSPMCAIRGGGLAGEVGVVIESGNGVLSAAVLRGPGRTNQTR
jgi:hypothetical protein